MSTKFITNQEELLSEVINNILPSTQKLYVLVGYFYFSGFEAIHNTLEDKEVKILVGLDIEKDLLNKIKEVEFIQDLNLSRGKIKDNFNKSLVSIFNDTDFFDSQEKQNAFRLFLKKLKDGTLEIKKTIQPNHAKLYIFKHKEEHSQGGVTPGVVITGSSNFTRSGLKDRCEINVILRDEYDEAYKIFKSLWDTAVNIVDKTNIEEFLTEVVEKIWIDKLPKPYLLYIRILEEFYSVIKPKNIKHTSQISKKYLSLKYQIDAIEQALRIIERHDGVIVADVVGLGKSIIASVVAHNLRLKTIIIAPPHLVEQWEDYRYEFDYNAKVYSNGKIEETLKENDDEEKKLIIIDEAHKYRNEETRDYGHLHQLCQGNKVMLLSATPFNNRPQDIFSMISLFQIVAKSTIQTVDNLSYQFTQLIKEYKAIQKSQRETNQTMKKEIKELADKIRGILCPVVIRRSRLDLEAIKEYKVDLKKQKIDFPIVHPPELLEYELGSLSSLYQETLEKIAPEDEEKGFIGARYKPVTYLKDIEKYKKEIKEEFGDEKLFRQAQINLAKFMRRLLVRRFESSVYAFQESLDSMINSSEGILTWHNKLGKVPIYKRGALPDIDALIKAYENDMFKEIEDIIQDEQIKRLETKGLKLIDKKEIKKQFIEDVEKDIKLLKEIRDEWFKEGIKQDPKLKHFKETIIGKLKTEPNRKIVVFTEFVDTAEYLFEQLPKSLRVFKYSSSDANKTNKKIIKENFDAGINEKDQKNDYDVLIATDAISEGFNLHRAGTVFNYDVPYNPTRVIQRVGRINRINKKVFDELFIYNFFPTATGEKETRIKQIATLKIALIHALLGEDTKVLTSDEELCSYYKEQYLELEQQQEELSWDVEYRNLIQDLKLTHPQVIEEAMKIPKRTRIKRTIQKEQKGVIVFARKGSEYTFKIGTPPLEYSTISQELALKLFKAEVGEKPEIVSKSFEKIYQNVKNNLFVKKSQVPYDKGKREAIDKITVLKEKLPEHKDYLEDLQYVLEKLDSLPKRYARQIRAISEKKLKEDVDKLIKEVPHKYLIELREKANSIDDEEESLILSEELI
ncbi:MAG: helicase-related protein [Nitrospirota bacterium]